MKALLKLLIAWCFDHCMFREKEYLLNKRSISDDGLNENPLSKAILQGVSILCHRITLLNSWDLDMR